MASSQRLAAILVTDIVGYTALMGSNKEEAMLLLQKNRTIHLALIHQFGGTYVKEIGDGTLAYFNSAHEAVKCAIAIQASIKKELNARLRMGIHMGEVIFEENDIFGDGVNIAARIEPLADPGGIYITETVEKALRGYPDIKSVYLGKARLKNVTYPVAIYAVTGEDLAVPSKKSFAKKARKRKVISLVPANVILYVSVPVLAAFLVYFFYNKEFKIANARRALLELEKIIDSSWRDYSQAYHFAKKLEKIIPGDPRLKDLIKRSSINITITSEPSGARVYIKEYMSPGDEWTYLGTTPLHKVELPITVFRWKLEKEGYDTVWAVAGSFTWNVNSMSRITKETMFAPDHFHRVLDKKGQYPRGMTRVRGGQFAYGKIPDFFIDRFEVRNRDFKEFISKGGYKNPAYWKHKFIKDNVELKLDDALALFVDKTGLPGPSTWEEGTFPEGEDNYPVRGVSWYEAAAFAEFTGKTLPTTDHWGLARGDQTFILQLPQIGGYALFVPFSNYNQQGPVETGKLDGLTAYGAVDMAGNVREWCWNESPAGRSIRGGAWNENTYSFSNPIQAPAFDRSITNGFRCALYPGMDSLPVEVFRPITTYQAGMPEKPGSLSNETFEGYKTFFGYDKTPLNEKIISRNSNGKDWTLEKIQYDAAYNNDKITAYLFLPKNSKPPYQAVIYLPGSAVFYQKNSDSIENYYEWPVFLDFIVKNGRAVLFPVYYGTFERTNASSLKFTPQGTGQDSHEFTEILSRFYKDFERSLDYLESREDIDEAKIGLYGMSHGASVTGPVFSALSSRIKLNIFISGGVMNIGRPEARASNYLSRIKQPTLLINGKFDSIFGEENIRTFFSHIGAKDKALKLFDTDHIPPRTGMVSETIAWLDKYFGPVRF